MKMNWLLFCIAIITITFASLDAARIKRDENFELEVCPATHPYAFDHGKV
jgi:hypothetical protein